MRKQRRLGVSHVSCLLLFLASLLRLRTAMAALVRGQSRIFDSRSQITTRVKSRSFLRRWKCSRRKEFRENFLPRELRNWGFYSRNGNGCGAQCVCGMIVVARVARKTRPSLRDFVEFVCAFPALRPPRRAACRATFGRPCGAWRCKEINRRTDVQGQSKFNCNGSRAEEPSPTFRP